MRVVNERVRVVSEYLDMLRAAQRAEARAHRMNEYDSYCLLCLRSGHDIKKENLRCIVTTKDAGHG